MMQFPVESRRLIVTRPLSVIRHLTSGI